MCQFILQVGGYLYIQNSQPHYMAQGSTHPARRADNLTAIC
jgi:hypothetical protein